MIQQQNKSFAQVTNSTTYINLQNLDITSLSYNTNSTPPTITLNSHKFNLTDYNQETGEYKIAGLEGTLFNPTTGQIQLLGQNQPTYFAIDQNNNFYALANNFEDLDEINSVTFNIDTGTQTINIDGTPYNLQPVAEGSSIYYIQNNGTNLAIYDSTTKQIITAGLGNSASLAQVLDGYTYTNSYINLQNLNITSLSYDIGWFPYVTLNGYKIELTDYNGNTDSYEIAGFENAFFDPDHGRIQLPGQAQATYFVTYGNNNTFYPLADTIENVNNITSVTIDNNNITIIINNGEPLNCTLVPITTAEGNTIYYVQDSSEKNIAIYNSNTKEIISAGQNNSINLNNNSKFIPTADGKSYVDLQQLEVNSFSYDIDSPTKTITLNGYEFELEPISGQSNQYKIAGLDNAIFNPTTGQIQFSEQKSIYIVADGDNIFTLDNVFPGIDDITYIGTGGVNQYITSMQINSGSNSVTYDLFQINKDYYYVISRDTGQKLAVYDSNTRKIIFAEPNNSINLKDGAGFAETSSSLNGAFVNLEKLNVTSLSFDTNTHYTYMRLNNYDFIVEYDTDIGSYNIARYSGASFDPTTGKIQLPGQEDIYFVITANNEYLNVNELNITSLVFNNNSITLNGHEINLTGYNQETGEYKFTSLIGSLYDSRVEQEYRKGPLFNSTDTGLEGTLFNPTTGQIQLPGQNQPTYFATYGDNRHNICYS